MSATEEFVVQRNLDSEPVYICLQLHGIIMEWQISISNHIFKGELIKKK